MSELVFYTNTTATIPAADGAVSFVYKTSGAAPVVVSAMGGSFSFLTGSAPGSFYYQMSNAAGDIVASGSFTLRQDLAHAATAFDPRSDAEKTLEAIDARIAGRALTLQQASITVDGRSIQYMNSIDELLKWREHFARIVAKEHGRHEPTVQVCKLRRV